MESTPGPSGRRFRFTSRFSGGTCRGNDTRLTARSRNVCPWGWLFYRRVKTDKTFWRPMNRTVRLHLRNIIPDNPDPDSPVFFGGGTRPNNRFRALCNLAGIRPKTEHRDRRAASLGAQGPSQDLRDVLRRARAGVVRRDTWALCRRNHLPPLRPSRSIGLSCHHDPAAALGVQDVGQWVRWAVPVLQAKIRRCGSLARTCWRTSGVSTLIANAALRWPKSDTSVTA